jgi:uncharacterized membrane protein YbhN (UPF0104 family)
MVGGRLDLPSWTMFDIATRLILFNYILPFKLGELSFPVMMKQAFGTSLLRSTGILILTRLLDFGVVAAILLLSGALLLDPTVLGWSTTVVVLAGIAALVLPFFGLDLLPWLRRAVAGWPRIMRLIDPLTSGAALIRPARQRALVAALSLAIWLCHALIAYLTAQAIAASLGFAHLAMASAAANLAFALPINGVAGLGPPQAAWASALRLAGVPWDSAITSALACQGLLLTAVLVLGLCSYLGRLGSGGMSAAPPSRDGSSSP